MMTILRTRSSVPGVAPAGAGHTGQFPYAPACHLKGLRIRLGHAALLLGEELPQPLLLRDTLPLGSVATRQLPNGS